MEAAIEQAYIESDKLTLAGLYIRIMFFGKVNGLITAYYDD